MGMLTGIRVLTLVELAFWFVRLFYRRCFRSSTTDIKQPAPRTRQKDDEIDALEKKIFARIEKKIETKMSMNSKSSWKRKKSTIRRQ